MINTHKRTRLSNSKPRNPSDKRQRSQNEGRDSNNQNSRINWQRKHEHFAALARTAAVSGNAIDAEGYYQHAEHYFRMMQGTAA